MKSVFCTQQILQPNNYDKLHLSIVYMLLGSFHSHSLSRILCTRLCTYNIFITCMFEE